jgi:3-methyladenine DNA glycosylase AlkD
MPTELESLRAALRALSRPESIAGANRFFKTGPGEYGEGDQFLGISVPEMRRISRQADALPQPDVLALLRSPIHEERLLALYLLVRRYERGDEAARGKIVRLYLRYRKYVNNWDLVDTSAPGILGAWLVSHDRSVLDELILSAQLWDRRMAMVSTLTLIRTGEIEPTFQLAAQLLSDPHDLMHKAAGWMLREAGKKDVPALHRFLALHAPAMPRTMLRYAIERFPPQERAAYLALPRITKSPRRASFPDRS